MEMSWSTWSCCSLDLERSRESAWGTVLRMPAVECSCVICCLSLLPHSDLALCFPQCSPCFFAVASWEVPAHCCFSSRRVSGTAFASGCRYPTDIKLFLHTQKLKPSIQGFLPKKQVASALLLSQISFRSYCLGVACLSPTMQELNT